MDVDTNMYMWIGVLVLSLVLIILFAVASSVKNAAKRKSMRERYAKMTGVAVGTVLSRRMVKKNVRRTKEGEDYDLKCIITYEFEAEDGKIYRNEGEGSGAFWERKQQKIRYNPEDPADNCTKYVYDDKMGISDAIGGILFLIIMAGIALAVYYVFKSKI